MPATLELGCGNRPTPGYVHHDRTGHADFVDVAWDLRVRPWPFVLAGRGIGLHRLHARAGTGDGYRALLRECGADGQVEAALAADPLPGGFLDAILALDVFEHVDAGDLRPCLDESWRLLVPGGRLEIRLPAWDNANTYRDPTHVRGYHEDTLRYWDTDHELCKDFGSVYFAESARWWKVDDVARENGDWRYTLTKRS